MSCLSTNGAVLCPRACLSTSMDRYRARHVELGMHEIVSTCLSSHHVHKKQYAHTHANTHSCSIVRLSLLIPFSVSVSHPLLHMINPTLRFMSIGGRITVFQSSLPSLGEGALKPRDDPGGTVPSLCSCALLSYFMYMKLCIWLCIDCTRLEAVAVL